MFVKSLIKYCKTTKTRYNIYRLCESYRFDTYIRHRTIIGLGKLVELETDELKTSLGVRIEELIKNGGNTLSTSVFEPKVEELAQYFFNEIKKKKRLDIEKSGEWENVDIKTLRNKDVKEIGAEWLCKQAFDQLGIADFLSQRGWNSNQISLATTHIISRAVYPASELKTTSWIKENSAICELTAFDNDKITKDLLYKISKKLFSEKHQLEQHLSKKTNELFDLQDKIILYDLTNTYFEGQMRKSKIAKFGRSKEKRSDAKIIVLAVVINQEGFLKYSNILEGNMSDCKTLETMVDELSNQTSFSQRKPIVVMDAGIATESNIELLRKKGYDYLCVSRSNLKNYQADTNCNPVQITDKKNQPIELMKVRVENDTDRYLWVKSQAKAAKENSMNVQFAQRFEEGLSQISKAINSKSGTKKLEKVWERIGRVKQKYPSINKYYEIAVNDDGKGIATNLQWMQKSDENKENEAGIYFLRTSLDEQNEETLWNIYNTIREIEYTFRVLKTDLDLRPIYHKTDAGAMAHLHLGILAYWLVNTIRYQLKQKGINSDWREIVRIANTQKCVTTCIENDKEQTISIRKCSEPATNLRKIYDALKYKYAPFVRRKSVVPPDELKKNKTQVYQEVMDD
jgi:hypothetical protein